MKKTSIVRKLMLAIAMLPLAVQTAQAEEFGSFGAPPKGFKVGYQTAQNGVTLIELVPQKQTVEGLDANGHAAIHGRYETGC